MFKRVFAGCVLVVIAFTAAACESGFGSRSGFASPPFVIPQYPSNNDED